MNMQEVALKLPASMLTELRRIAAEDDVSIGTLVREAISRDLARREAIKLGGPLEKEPIEHLKTHLERDFLDARSWVDLLDRLRAKGYDLAEAGSGLVLIDKKGQRICKGSELG